MLRAQLYIQQNDLQSAMDDLDSSLKLQPDATTPLVLRARLNFYQGNFDTALTDYNHLIQLQPDKFQLLHGTG